MDTAHSDLVNARHILSGCAHIGRALSDWTRLHARPQRTGLNYGGNHGK